MSLSCNFGSLRVTYDQSGSGSAVVLLHGFCEDASMWDTFAPVLLSDEFHVIRVNLPGFGGSDTMVDATIPKFAEVVLAVLDACAVTAPAFILGHSMGGYVAANFALQFPTRTAGMAFLHSHPFEDDATRKTARTASSERVMRDGSEAFAKSMFLPLVAPGHRERVQGTIKQIVDKAALVPPTAIAAALVAMRDRPDTTCVLNKTDPLPLPVLVIIGSEDPAVPPAMAAAITDSAGPHCKIITFEGVGHMGMFEVPSEFQEAVLGWLRSLQ